MAWDRIRFVAGLAAIVAAPAFLCAQTNPPTIAVGSYRCLSYNVSGGGGSCASFQRLVLNPDGTYQFSSTRGRWSVENGNLILSSSRLWGPGRIQSDHTVRFEYDYGRWHHVLTWGCQGCTLTSIPTGQPGRTVTGNPSDGIGVTLTLQFTQPIGGVTGFVLVPADAASSYQHNAPLPPGAVSGGAWETGNTTVKLATSRDNRVIPGARYVVFLTWARETIPVAILDVPRTNQDYTGTLNGTLDGASVLARIKQPS